MTSTHSQFPLSHIAGITQFGCLPNPNPSLRRVRPVPHWTPANRTERQPHRSPRAATPLNLNPGSSSELHHRRRRLRLKHLAAVARLAIQGVLPLYPTADTFRPVIVLLEHRTFTVGAVPAECLVPHELKFHARATLCHSPSHTFLQELHTPAPVGSLPCCLQKGHTIRVGLRWQVKHLSTEAAYTHPRSWPSLAYHARYRPRPQPVQ